MSSVKFIMTYKNKTKFASSLLEAKAWSETLLKANRITYTIKDALTGRIMVEWFPLGI
ncbi:hypothetical protein NV379_02210 [Paenibacillus sp. N1-5-1-14]|uniref:hypothetical protein n=1 Tax=Paenibacillus radicibacter TaxID=2972488 RepID=UPI002159AC0A|nr:hypothetical protein [Paenibacillus radicibacter]MCR8641460.1 hypothetical protein [Paenibacillus radicibacter]